MSAYFDDFHNLLAFGALETKLSAKKSWGEAFPLKCSTQWVFFFRWISILMLLLCDQSHTDQIWHGNSRGEGMFVRGQACPCPKWWGPIVPNIILDPLLMHTPFDVEHPKFGVVPCMERTCYRGKPCPRSHGVGPFAVQF